jgi:molybdopterin synthase catalytic subunit
MNQIKVLFFATLKEVAGSTQTVIELPEKATVADLKIHLTERIPNIKDALPNAVVSVNQDYAEDDVVIPDGAEIAIFPPVSGGAEPPSLTAITEDPLDLNALLNPIILPTTGAACLFIGTVRSITTRVNPHLPFASFETNYLEYEAYKPMAEAKLRQIADEIRQHHPDIEGISIVQRVGKLDPGTPTVMVACSASHRDKGVFEAARYGIDRLKQIVPVWKKEISPDGATWIEGEYVPQPGKD